MTLRMDFNEIVPSNVLHWNYRGFTEFPTQLIRGEEHAITDVYLKENLLSRLPSDIGMLRHLESLYISGNDITELPKEISQLHCLKCLDASGNRLKRVPDEISEVRNLKFLILDENELRELPLRLVELRSLRYLSVCDNKLKWLPQRPVYNYYHCEFRFWRNPNLKTLPYSLWYHMFRDQQTRTLNIGCLKAINNQSLHTEGHTCKLKITEDSKEWELNIELPSQYNNVLEPNTSMPPSLLELSKRTLYQMISDTAKRLTPATYSIYRDNYREYINVENNNNITDLEHDFEGFNINYADRNEKCDLNGNIKQSDVKKVKKSYPSGNCVPADIIEDNYFYLPHFIKGDLINGPISRCENVSCKKPVFDHVYYEFCYGKIILIDNTEDVILNAAFCSKTCAEKWKFGKNTFSWKLSNV